MIYKTRGIVLKDGRSAILRAPRESDAEEMLEYLRTASGETDFLASYPEELKFTAEGEIFETDLAERAEKRLGENAVELEFAPKRIRTLIVKGRRK